MPAAVRRAKGSATPLVVEQVRIAGGPFRLEGELVYPENAAVEGVAVIAGPHPFLGGNMANNVVRALGDGLAGDNLLTLRFNYRGVGGSEGPAVDVAQNMTSFWHTGHAPAEMELRHDLEAAVRFARGIAGEKLPLVLIGYSFGCALLPFVEAASCTPQVLIAPTLGKHDYDQFQTAERPILVIASNNDFAVEQATLRAWFTRLGSEKQLIVKRLDNHFFRGHEAWVVEMVLRFISQRWR